MKLDYAIRHAKEVALTCEDSKCAAEHAQLAKWLIELKISREHPFSELQDEFRHLAEENERLRDENTRLNAKMSTRLYGIKAENVKRYREASDGLCMEECKRILVEQAREGEVDRLVNENAKLRELAKDMLVYVAHTYVCIRPEVLVERACELGIEADGCNLRA